MYSLGHDVLVHRFFFFNMQMNVEKLMKMAGANEPHRRKGEHEKVLNFVYLCLPFVLHLILETTWAI